MRDLVNVRDLTSPRIVLIDMTTGTVLGTNVVAAYLPENREDEVTNSDTAAWDWANDHGQPVYIDMEEA